jgi:hypothetical protein
LYIEAPESYSILKPLKLGYAYLDSCGNASLLIPPEFPNYQELYVAPFLLTFTDDEGIIRHKKYMFLTFNPVSNSCTVRTVAADLRQGEQIPKMQNDIGRKSTLRVLRQPRSKGGGGGRSAQRCTAAVDLRFTLDRILNSGSGKNTTMGPNLHPSGLQSVALPTAPHLLMITPVLNKFGYNVNPFFTQALLYNGGGKY